MKLSVLAIALVAVFGSTLACADEPAVGSGELVVLAPDSTAAPSGPASQADASNSSTTSSTSPSEPNASSVAPASSAAPVAPAAADPAPTAVPALSSTPTVPDAAAPAPKRKSARAQAKSVAAKVATTKPATTKPRVDPPSPGTNQTPIDEGTRVRTEIERTEPVLRAVHAKVLRSFNKKAREEFEKAATLQRDARDALSQNLYARSERLTQESRTLAREIAVHLGPPQDDPDYVAMTLDRTDDAIGRAREVLKAAGGEAEQDRLTALERRQKDARRLQKDGSTRDAYAATRDVRDGILTLLRDCDDLPVPAETAEKALKRATRALEQAKGELGERPTIAAEKLARDARAQMEKARAAYARKNYRDTLLHSKLVERDLELAVSAQRSATNRSG